MGETQEDWVTQETGQTPTLKNISSWRKKMLGILEASLGGDQSKEGKGGCADLRQCLLHCYKVVGI